jgi:hypothetical protein
MYRPCEALLGQRRAITAKNLGYFFIFNQFVSAFCFVVPHDLEHKNADLRAVLGTQAVEGQPLNLLTVGGAEGREFVLFECEQ